jgi:hypothetical protein
VFLFKVTGPSTQRSRAGTHAEQQCKHDDDAPPFFFSFSFPAGCRAALLCDAWQGYRKLLTGQGSQPGYNATLLFEFSVQKIRPGRGDVRQDEEEEQEEEEE